MLRGSRTCETRGPGKHRQRVVGADDTQNPDLRRTGKLAFRSAHYDGTELGPVDLCLFSGRDLQADASERLLTSRGTTVALTPKALDLLLALVDQAGRLLDKETLLKMVWPDSFVEEKQFSV